MEKLFVPEEDEHGRINVSFDEFNAYMLSVKEDGDYTVDDADQIKYFGLGGCLLAKYDYNENCGYIY